MKIEIKKYKNLPGAGMEGDAFTAELWADGVLRAKVSNSGDGGDNRYSWLANGGNTFWGWQVPADISAHLASLPDYPEGHLLEGMRPDLDTLVGDLIEKAELANLCARWLLFRLPCDPEGDYRKIPCKKPTPELAAAVRKQWPAAVIVNEGL